MAKQVIDIKPGKGFSSAQSNEHLRKYSEGAYQNLRSNNFDPTRVHLDFEITKGGRVVPLDDKHSIPQRIKEILTARGIKDPNDGLEEPKYRTIANIILGGSRDQMRRLAFGAQNVNFTYGADNSHVVREKGIEQWAVDTYNFIANKYGEENIVAFTVHLDETNPHVHCTLLPINPEKNRFSWGYRFGYHKEEGRKIFKELHDEFAKVNAKYGLERGDDIRVTGAKHRTTEEYKQWLWEECNKLEKEADGKRRMLRMLDDEIRRAQIKVKGLTTMINNLNDQKTGCCKRFQICRNSTRMAKFRLRNLTEKQQNSMVKLKRLRRKSLIKRIYLIMPKDNFKISISRRLRPAMKLRIYR